MKRAQIIDQKIRSIAQRERNALAELLIELRELESFRGYEELRFTSLFDYLTKGLSYSAGAAQRRIDAARLLSDVPDLGEKLQSGALDLHHVTTVSKAVRQVSKHRKVSAGEKRAIIEQLECQPTAATQQKVAEFFDLEVITSTRRTVQKDGSVRFEITMSRGQAEKLERAQALVSHAVPTNNVVDFLEYVSEWIIKQKAEPARERKAKSTATVAVEAEERVSERAHREVRSEQPTCAECGTSWFPQTDHRRSRWAGGGNEQDNLQTLCGPCNRAKYRRERRATRAGEDQ